MKAFFFTRFQLLQSNFNQSEHFRTPQKIKIKNTFNLWQSFQALKIFAFTITSESIQSQIHQKIIYFSQCQMSFLDQDYRSLSKDQKAYTEAYDANFSCVSRYVFMLHSLDYLIGVKKSLNSNEKAGIFGLTNNDMRGIKWPDSSEFLAEKAGRKFEEIAGKLKEGEKIEGDHVFDLVTSIFKWELATVVTLFCIDSVFRIAISVLILYLFTAVADGEPTIAYIYAGIIVAISYICQLMKQTGYVRSHMTASRIKSSLSMLLYAKTSSLTSYVIKSSQLGKITNLLASDLGVIENRLASFLGSFNFPVYAIGGTTLLVIRLGWPGILGILLVILSLPLSNCVSKYNSTLIQDINVYKDKRIQTTSEVIEGIKFVKLYGWEIAFKRIIQGLREMEISNYRRLSFGKSLERALSNFVGIASGFLMYIVAHYAGTHLSIPKIFSTLEVIFAFKYSIFMLGVGLGFYYEVKVVFERFASIFSIKRTSMIEIDPETKEPIHQAVRQKDWPPKKQTFGLSFQVKVNNQSNQNIVSVDEVKVGGEIYRSSQSLKNGEISFKDFNGYWKNSFDVPSLKDINIFFQKGVFYGITGRVGSGKSGLLGVILGELPYYSGQFKLKGRISYVEQEPIVFSDTIRNNILFGITFDQQKYDSVVEQSCLIADFQILQHGDATMVGEKGITLSGGQKARLALARALYADGDIFILDDPISAVDSKVAHEIHEKCLKRLKSTKTLILVTHQISFLYDCDQVIIMDDGKIVKTGPPSALTVELREMSAIFKGQEESEEQQAISAQLIRQQQQELIEHLSSHRSEVGKKKADPSVDPVNKLLADKHVGITFSTYGRYFMANPFNYFLFPLTIITFITNEIVLTFYLRFLANYDLVRSGDANPFDSNFPLFWGILGMMVGLHFLTLFLKYLFLYLTLLNSNTSIHQTMVNGIVRSPASFFDTTPSGVLINKFSNDLGILDNALPISLIDTFEGPTSIVVAMINICQIYPFFIPPVIVVFFFGILFFFYSRPVIVQSKQLDLANKNPIFHTYAETITGLVQINTYGRRRSLIDNFSKIINRSTTVAIGFDLVSRGFGFYQSVMGLALMLMGMTVGTSQSSHSTAGLYGIVIIYLFNFCDYYQWFLRQIITSESLLISYERALQITNLPSEKELRTQYDEEIGLSKQVEAARKDENLHMEWPDKPDLQFKDLSARYKPELPLVIKNLNLSVKRHSKVGVVGRTGAGKSSIIQAIFRIIEPELGSHYAIGGGDALRMGLHSLRQHISVIPQTPFLFKGTVRQNVDPFDTASEERIWTVLCESGLDAHVRSLPKQLLTDISNTSESFSVGQKQLLCLARALLRRNKFLVLDEATSNVDMETDAFIQATIKEKFSDTTVITVAHRLNTIADYDQVIVMQRGRIIESGSPWELIQKQGTFYEMVNHTGKNAPLIIAKAKNSHQAKMR